MLGHAFFFEVRGCQPSKLLKLAGQMGRTTTIKFQGYLGQGHLVIAEDS